MMHSILILFIYLKKQFLLNIRRYNYNWLLLKFEYFMMAKVSEISILSWLKLNTFMVKVSVISILSWLKFNRAKAKNWEELSFNFSHEIQSNWAYSQLFEKSQWKS